MSFSTAPRTLWTILSGLLFLTFAVIVLDHAFFFTFDADEAYNATTAKNWLRGYGYASSIGVIFPFDPYISSGPGYTALAAIPIAVLGNDPDVVKPFMAAVHLLLLGAALLQAARLIPDRRQFCGLLLFSLGWFCVIEFKFWHRSAGELLSLLYFANGALLAATAWQRRSAALACVAGIAVAAAVLTKNQAWLFVAGLLPALAIATLQQWRHTPALRMTLGYCWLAFCVPAGLLLAAWSQYEARSLQALAAQDPHLYEYYLGKQWHFFSTHGSGLNLFWEIHTLDELLKRESQLVSLAFDKFRSAFSRLGAHTTWGAAGCWLLAALGILVAVQRFWREQRLHELFLALPLLAFFAWALLLNNSVYMHQMLPGIWLTILLAGITLAAYRAGLLALGFAALGIVAGTAGKYGEFACLDASNAACLHTQPNPIRESRDRALAYLAQHTLPAPLANCGWYFAQDIEFALPGVNNIRDCMRLFDDAVAFDASTFITANKLPDTFRQDKTEADLIKLYVHKRKNLFGASFVAPVTWKQPLAFTYIANIYMTGNSLEQKRNVTSFLDHCQQVLYADDFYYIRYCSPDDLRAYVAEWGGLPIFTHSWEALYYRDFMRETKPLTPLGWGADNQAWRQ